MNTENSALLTVEIFMDAWDARDYAALERIVDDNCVFRSSIGIEPGETVSGKEAVLSRMHEMIAEETDEDSTSGRFWEVDGQVFAEWSYESTLADGRQVTVKGLDRIHVVEGKIIEIDAYRKSF